MLALNPKRKRRKGRARNRRRVYLRRRRNPLYRGKRGRFASRGRSKLRRYRGGGWKNPGIMTYNASSAAAPSLSHPVGAVMSGFKPKALLGVLPIGAGAFAGFWVRNKVADAIVSRGGSAATWTAPKSLGSYAVGLGTAGLMLLIPRFGRQMFTGALTVEVLRAANDFLLPEQYKFRLLGDYLESQSMSGMDEFLTNRGAANVGPLNGMDDFLETAAPMAGFGDFLTADETSSMEM